MNKSLLTVAVLMLSVFSLVFYSCKKPATPRASVNSAEDVRQQEMLKKSYDDMKRVVIVKVNGEPITQFMVDHAIAELTPVYAPQNQKRTKELFLKIRDIALNELIMRELIVQEAKKRGMKANPKQIEAAVADVKHDAGSDAAYRDYLANNGLTEEMLKKSFEYRYLYESITEQEIYSKVPVTEAALKERYARDRDNLKTADQRVMTFEAARSELAQRIKVEGGEKKLREWVAELSKHANVEIIKTKPD